MKKTIFKILAVFLAVVLMFCVTTEPLFVSASNPSLDYVETDLTTAEVTSLIDSLGTDISSAIIWIVGLICVLFMGSRLIDAGVDSSNIMEVGQYALDNMTSDIKNIFYSVYSFMINYGYSGLDAVPVFDFVSIGKFYRSLKGFAGSVTEPDTTTQGVLDVLYPSSTFSPTYPYSYETDFSSWITPWTSIPYSSCIGYCRYMSYALFQSRMLSLDFSSFDTENCVVVYNFTDETYLHIGVYTVQGGNLIFTPFSYYYTSDITYSKNSFTNNPDLAPSVTRTKNITWNYVQDINGPITFGVVNETASDMRWFTSYFLSALSLGGNGVYQYKYTGSLPSFLTLADVISGISPAFTDANNYVNTPDETLTVDAPDIIDGIDTHEIDSTVDLVNAIVDDAATTIESVNTSDVPSFDGTYYIPGLDSVWKYVEYMFDTLGGWIAFAGRCIVAVTVGEGGLSWIFFGGFIFLICGGIVGKILLG